MSVEFRTTLEDPDRLAALARSGLLDTPAEEAFDRFTRLAARLLDAPVALVSLVDSDRQFCKSAVGLPEPAATARELPLSHSMCRHVVASGEPLVVGDTTEHPATRDNAAVTELGARAYAGVPLVSRDGQTLGSFCVIDLRTRQWTDEQIATLRDLAAAVITVIELRTVTRLEQEQAEVALRRREENYRLLSDAIPQQIWVTRPDGYHEFYNRRWYEYTGTTPDEAGGGGWADPLHPDDRERTAARWQHSLETGEPYSIEYRFRRAADGAYRWFLGQALPQRGRNGEIVRWFGTLTDIDDQKRAETDRERLLGELETERTRLAETTELLRFLDEAGALLATSLDPADTLRNLTRLAVPKLADWCAIYEVDSTGTPYPTQIAHVDPAKVEFAWRFLRQYMPEPDAPVGVSKVLRTGESDLLPEISESLLEAVARDPEHLRQLRALKLSAMMVVPLRARGRTLGAIGFYSATAERTYDAAALELAEELARRAAVTLDNTRLLRETAAERARILALLDSADEGIYGIDQEGRCNFINQAATDMVGYESEECVGRAMHALIHHHHADGTPFPESECPIYEATRQNRTVRIEDDVLWRKDGSFFAAEYSAAPVTGSDGAAGAVVSFRDITRRKRQEAERERLIAQLETSNRELDQFAYVASHDLKAPLRGIANLSQWVEEDLGEGVPEEVREHLELLRGRVHRMEGLIDGILQFSRAGRVRNPAEPVDVGALLDEVVDLLAPPDSVGIRIEPGMPTIRTDRLPLQQVFMNLIGNAIKYTQRPDAEVRVGVRVGVRDVDGRWEFSVADNGPGIAPEYHDRIFAIFQTLQARDKVEGTGIGLSLVKKIVESRGGRVRVESAEGSGATFLFDWPAGGDRPS